MSDKIYKKGSELKSKNKKLLVKVEKVGTKQVQALTKKAIKATSDEASRLLEKAGIKGEHNKNLLRRGDAVMTYLQQGSFRSKMAQKFLDRLDTHYPIGIMRVWLLIKMALNMLSVVVFTFYSSIYLDDENNGSYVFVLFLTMLSFVSCVSGAVVITIHDMVSAHFDNTVYAEKLLIGKLTGDKHMQYYAAVLVSLGNLVYRMFMTGARSRI